MSEENNQTILNAKSDFSVEEEKIDQKKRDYYFKGPYYNEKNALWVHLFLQKIQESKRSAIFKTDEFGLCTTTLMAKIIQGWNFLIERVAEEPWKSLKKDCKVSKRGNSVIIIYKPKDIQPRFVDDIDGNTSIIDLYSSWQEEIETFINAADRGSVFVKTGFVVEKPEELESFLKGVFPEDLYMMVVSQNVVKVMKK